MSIIAKKIFKIAEFYNKRRLLCIVVIIIIAFAIGCFAINAYKNNKQIKIGNPQSYREGASESISSIDRKAYYFKRKNSVFCYSDSMSYSGYSENVVELKNSDPDSFEIIDSNYAKDKNYVYGKSHKGLIIACTTIEKADPKTFTPLDWPYAKDKNNIYYDLIKILDGADPNSFEFINEEYSKDKNYIWINDNLVQGANPKTFTIVNANITKDDDQVWYNSWPLKNVNVDSFVILSEMYFKDVDHVWYKNNELFDVDINTFEVFENGIYAKDKNNVYDGKYKIIGADPDTFILLDYDYMKDKNNVYIAGNIISNADPNTFKILDYKYTKDKDNVWYKNKQIIIETSSGAINVDAQSFETLSNKGCAKDKNYYYRYGEIVDSKICEEESTHIYKNNDFSLSMTHPFQIENQVIKPQNKNDFSQITFWIKDREKNFDQDELLQWEKDHIQAMCKDTSSCGTIVSSEKIKINNVEGIKFVVKYDGRRVNDLEGFTNGYYYAFSNNKNHFRFWTSATDLEDYEKIKNEFKKIINTINFN